MGTRSGQADGRFTEGAQPSGVERKGLQQSSAQTPVKPPPNAPTGDGGQPKAT